MRRSPLILNLVFLIGALAASLDGWSGLPVGAPPGHAAVAQRSYGGGTPWALLSAILADDDERGLPGSHGSGAADLALPAQILPPHACAWARLPVRRDPPHRPILLSAASPRGPPRVS
ncbi:hypothetical protein [Methylobacterium sp. WSM2598]|uniref:hypothetical protein n=1 Tax=Methylobacterium sp. WSM2598 TaxID=398261 RepID=UPI0003787467|nr:hypothetical protein [Methylobacterium sp. WSM2598]